MRMNATKEHFCGPASGMNGTKSERNFAMDRKKSEKLALCWRNKMKVFSFRLKMGTEWNKKKVSLLQSERFQCWIKQQMRILWGISLGFDTIQCWRMWCREEKLLKLRPSPNSGDWKNQMWIPCLSQTYYVIDEKKKSFQLKVFPHVCILAKVNKGCANIRQWNFKKKQKKKECDPWDNNLKFKFNKIKWTIRALEWLKKNPPISLSTRDQRWS